MPQEVAKLQDMPHPIPALSNERARKLKQKRMGFLGSVMVEVFLKPSVFLTAMSRLVSVQLKLSLEDRKEGDKQ